MHPRTRLLVQASDRLTAAADAVGDVGLRSSVAAAAEIDDCRARRPPVDEVARIERSLGDLEQSISGSASVTVRRARRDLARYCEAAAPSLSPPSSST
jgi:hypothetical protein